VLFDCAETMFCQNCGHAIESERGFCPACGTRIGGSTHVAESRKTAGREKIGCLVLIALIVILALFSGDKDQGQRRAAPSIGIGEAVRVGWSDSPEPVIVGITPEDLDSFFAAVHSKDDYGRGQLVLSGRVFLLERGTTVRILELGFTKTKIRVLEGAQQNQAGWVVTEAVAR